MDVVVAGGHGQIAQHLLRLLAQRGDRARGLIRNPDHAAGLDHTIVRPGMLTDEPGTGTVTAGPDAERNQVTREDVAAVLAAVLNADNTIGKTFVLVQGETPVAEAVAAI